jgi:hypothetical protein
MAKIGKVNVKKIKEDKAERSRDNKQFANWLKFSVGPNFIRMLPPGEGEALPWVKTRKHFGLGPNGNAIANCTEGGRNCYACKRAKVLSNSPDKKEQALGSKQRVSISYTSQVIDMSPLYSKKKVKGSKNKYEFVADNPPPKCWGKIQKDDEGDYVGKCQRCSWNESCGRGIQLMALSGQRTDDIADSFDEGDITDLKTGRNILVKRKGEGMGTSYTIESDEDYDYELPKQMIKYVEENFKDLREEVKPSTPEEIEEIYKGESSENEGLPECFGEFDTKKKKCKKCEVNDICSEESEPEEAEPEDEEEEEAPFDEDDEEAEEEEVEEDEEDEDDEEDEEEDEEEEDDEDVLAELNRKELKAFIKENELDVKVKKSMSDDDIRDAIREEIDEDDEDEDEDEEEEEDIKTKLKKKAKKK